MKTKELEKVKNNEELVKDIYNQISDIVTNNKNKMIYQINNTLVETRNTNILGGTENTKKTSKQNKKASKIFIDSMSILGSTKIK